MLCQYTVGAGNSTNFVRSSSAGTIDLKDTTGTPINTRGNVTVSGGMLTSNEQYISSVKNWTSIQCPMQRAFTSGTELPIKVGDSVVYRSGFKVFASATSTSVLNQG